MAYNNYFPQGYYPQYYGNPQVSGNPLQTAQSGSVAQNNGIIWVQGEAAAKAYPVGSGQSVLLMDSEDSVFYIKSTDQSGMPQPLRVFDYKEKNSRHSEVGAVKKDEGDYVSRKEFEEFRDGIKKVLDDIREEGEG